MKVYVVNDYSWYSPDIYIVFRGRGNKILVWTVVKVKVGELGGELSGGFSMKIRN